MGILVGITSGTSFSSPKSQPKSGNTMRAKKMHHFIYQLDEMLCPQNYAPKMTAFFKCISFQTWLFWVIYGGLLTIGSHWLFHRSAGPGRPGHPPSLMTKRHWQLSHEKTGCLIGILIINGLLQSTYNCVVQTRIYLKQLGFFHCSIENFQHPQLFNSCERIFFCRQLRNQRGSPWIQRPTQIFGICA